MGRFIVGNVVYLVEEGLDCLVIYKVLRIGLVGSGIESVRFWNFIDLCLSFGFCMSCFYFWVFVKLG